MNLSNLPMTAFWLVVAGLLAIMGSRVFGRVAQKASI